MEFLHPTDFPLIVLTEASHFSADGVGGEDVVVVVFVIEIGVVLVAKIGFVLVLAVVVVVVALTSLDAGAIS